mmetsp:Transcript_1228/g.2617  ORF Transcript_1228/g.2617 Transcript_1228/m.2617 type:complete len:470 (-) Transcript_1228:29-1438(-)
MIASFVGVVNLLGLSQAADVTSVDDVGAVAVGAVAAGPALARLYTNDRFTQEPLFFHHMENADQINNRHLVWSATTTTVCDAATMERVRLINSPLTTVVSCLAFDIQWDPDALLVLSYVTATYSYWSGDLDVQTTLVAEYTPTGGLCELFDRCILTDSFQVLLEQYTYDCSNVYCGEHAIRDCRGNYQSVACPQGTINQEIPAMAQIFCERALASLSDTDRTACNPTSCQFAQSTIIAGTWSYTCQLQATGGDARCLEATVSQHFGEYYQHTIVCKTDANGNEFCTFQSYGPVVILESSAVSDPVLLHDLLLCHATYNDEDCESCTPCGEAGITGTLEYGQALLPEIDCSNIQANSRLNACDQTATGILEFYYAEGGDLPCPSSSATSSGGTGGGDTTGTNNGNGSTSATATGATSGGTGDGGQGLMSSGGTNLTNNGNGSTSAAAIGAAVAFSALVVAMMGVFVATSL